MIDVLGAHKIKIDSPVAGWESEVLEYSKCLELESNFDLIVPLRIGGVVIDEYDYKMKCLHDYNDRCTKRTHNKIDSPVNMPLQAGK